MVLGNTLNILRPPSLSTPPIQTGWNEDLVKNMHKVLGEMAQQITLRIFGGLPEGASRPASVKANGSWLDITSVTAPIVKLFDGTDDITVMTFDYSTNAVTFAGVTTDLVNDLSPQLGGNLDLNGNVITGLEIGTDLQAFDATLDSLAGVAGIEGDILFASGTDAWARLAKGSDGEILKLASGLPSWVTTGITRYSEVITTSGTAHTITSIPAGTNRVTVMLDEVSLTGTNELLLQIGDAGGIEDSVYVSRASAGTTGSGNVTDGFILTVELAAANKTSGNITLNRMAGNTWVSSGTLDRNASTNIRVSAGRKTLSTTLDRVSLTRTGSDTFNGGSFSILSEI